MHDAPVIKTDPEGELAYTNIMTEQSVLLDICRPHFPTGSVTFGLFLFLNNSLPGG